MPREDAAATTPLLIAADGIFAADAAYFTPLY